MDAGVRFSVSTQVERLEREAGGSRGMGQYRRQARATDPGRSRRGACVRGFSNDASAQAGTLQARGSGRPHASPVIASNVGDGLRLGCRPAAWLRNQLPDNAAWMPVSWSRCPGAAFPHVIDRAKPGMIAVLRDGRDSSTNPTRTMTSAVRTSSRAATATIFLICDRRALRRYGLGFVKPFPFPVGKHVKSELPDPGRVDRGPGRKERNRRREPG